MVAEVKSMFLQLFYEYAEGDRKVARVFMEVTILKFKNTSVGVSEEDSHHVNMHDYMMLRRERCG